MTTIRHKPEQVVEMYVDLERGNTLRIPRVSNITRLKEAFIRHGLKPRVDFVISHQGPYCVIKRLSANQPT